MNNKGEANIGNIILVSLLVMVVVGGFILMLILVNEKTTKQESLENSMNIYIKNIDNQTKTQVGGKYYVVYKNNIISQGDLSKNSLTEVKGILSKNVKVYCKENGYYLASTEKNFTKIEIFNNASKITCNSNSYGNLIIESKSNINKETGYITLSISSKREFHNVSGVISWESGTIWVKHKNEVNVPSRFRDSYDYAFETGISLKDSNSSILLEYKAIPQRNSDDCIKITLYDKDYYVDNGILKTENGENLGNPKDFTKTFCYEN